MQTRPCIYCCGIRAGDTDDHSPARSFFRVHGAPKGFVYPACRKCNATKKDDESRFAAIAGVFNLLNPHDQSHWDDVMRRAAAHVGRNEAFRRAIEEANDGALDSMASLALPGASRSLRSEPPRVTLPDEFYESLFRVGFWICLSLYSRANKTFCPPDARVGVRVFNNLELSDPLLELNQLLGVMNRETPIPEQKSVPPMFSWAWQFPANGEGIIAAELHGCVVWLAAFNRGAFDEGRIANADWFSWEQDTWSKQP